MRRPSSKAELDRLWADIEASGPLGPDGASESAPPPGVDPIWWAERSHTQEDRRRSFIARYAWCVPAREAIEAIADFAGARAILEICAGSGLWARLLGGAGGRVLATDGSPCPPASGAYVEVEALEAEQAVREHPEADVLLLVWPPMRDSCAIRATRAFAGDRLIYAGDVRFTADAAFHGLLAHDWQLLRRLPLPYWPGLDDAVYLYERAPATTR